MDAYSRGLTMSLRGREGERMNEQPRWVSLAEPLAGVASAGEAYILASLCGVLTPLWIADRDRKRHVKVALIRERAVLADLQQFCRISWRAVNRARLESPRVATSI